MENDAPWHPESDEEDIDRDPARSTGTLVEFAGMEMASEFWFEKLTPAFAVVQPDPPVTAIVPLATTETIVTTAGFGLSILNVASADDPGNKAVDGVNVLVEIVRACSEPDEAEPEPEPDVAK
jgi:hypothetical protein